MGAENQKVVRVDQPVLRIAPEEILRMVDEVLIEWTGRCHIDRRGSFPSPTGPANLLPGAGDGTGIFAKYCRFQVPDIYPELQRVGGHLGRHRNVLESVRG